LSHIYLKITIYKLKDKENLNKMKGDIGLMYSTLKKSRGNYLGPNTSAEFLVYFLFLLHIQIKSNQTITTQLV